METKIIFTTFNKDFSKLLKNLGWWTPIEIIIPHRHDFKRRMSSYSIHSLIKKGIVRSKSLNFLSDIEFINYDDYMNCSLE